MNLMHHKDIASIKMLNGAKIANDQYTQWEQIVNDENFNKHEEIAKVMWRS